jgi:hypothetical protein
VDRISLFLPSVHPTLAYFSTRSRFLMRPRLLTHLSQATEKRAFKGTLLIFRLTIQNRMQIQSKIYEIDH